MTRGWTKLAIALTAVSHIIIAQTVPSEIAQAVERDWGKQSGPFQLSIAADKKQYGADETIMLTATFKERWR